MKSLRYLLSIVTLNGVLVVSVSCLTYARAPEIAGTSVFPGNNVWNSSVASLPVHPNSKKYIESIGSTKQLHPDFGAGAWEGRPMGIPINIVGPATKRFSVSFEYSDESDRVPYPIPEKPKVEGGLDSDGDRHLIAVDPANAKLYELYQVRKAANGSWSAGSGAVFDLRSNAQRPEGWTSADAAGLPIMPGLLKYSELASGSIEHALRFTAARTQRSFVWPATHFASSETDKNLPPMGIRLRLRSDFDESSFPQDCQIILRCLKKYGMLLADNGSSWYISGEPDERWNNESLHQLSRVSGAEFEVVDESGLMVKRNSGECKQQDLPQRSPN